MTQRQEAHLDFIKTKFLEMVDPKFRAGAEEHGGDLMDMAALQLVDNALLECIDQFTYLLTLRIQLEAEAMIRKYAAGGMTSEPACSTPPDSQSPDASRLT